MIGAVGLNGSGKDIILKRLQTNYGVPLLSIGNVAREIAKEEGVAATRDNLHDISEKYIARHGPTYFPQRVIDSIDAGVSPTAGVSGIRTPADVKCFQDRYKDRFVLVHVDVKDDRLRFERLHARGEARDPETFEDFLAQDASEEEIFQLSETIARATEKVNNDGDLSDLYLEVDRLAGRLFLNESSARVEGRQV